MVQRKEGTNAAGKPATRFLRPMLPWAWSHR